MVNNTENSAEATSSFEYTANTYQKRLVREYYQLKERAHKLRDYIMLISTGHADTEYEAQWDVLNAQLRVMEAYESILAVRASLEGIALTGEEES